MIVYIAGPMTGHKDFNYPAFNAAEDELRAFGHEPINPARHGDDDRAHAWTWVDFMRRTIRDVTNADAIHLLDGWEDSRGARLEATIADALGLQRIGSQMPRKEPRDAPSDSDPADYGYDTLPRGGYAIAIIPNRGPEVEVCRSCGHVAIEHTAGRFSIYGICPPRTDDEAATEGNTK